MLNVGKKQNNDQKCARSSLGALHVSLIIQKTLPPPPQIIISPDEGAWNINPASLRPHSEHWRTSHILRDHLYI